MGSSKRDTGSLDYSSHDTTQQSRTFRVQVDNGDLSHNPFWGLGFRADNWSRVTVNGEPNGKDNQFHMETGELFRNVWQLA